MYYPEAVFLIGASPLTNRRFSGKETSASTSNVVCASKLGHLRAGAVQRGSLTVWLSAEAIDGWHYAGPTQRGEDH